MAFDWNYDESDYEQKGYVPLPIGDYRVRVSEVEQKTASSGNEMMKLTLDISGDNRHLWHNLVFIKDNPKVTNQMLGAFYDSFGVSAAERQNEQSWIGKVGACKVKHEDYKGEPQAKIAYFIGRSRQDKLAPWIEPSNAGSSGSVNSVDAGFVPLEINEDDLPF